MDNSYILLLILKKEINVSEFLLWLRLLHDFESIDIPSYIQYTTRFNDITSSSLGLKLLDEFEFCYFTSYLRLRGII